MVCDMAELDPGSVGLALSYAMTLTGMFQWGVRQSAEIENMVSPFPLGLLLNILLIYWKCSSSNLIIINS